MKREATFFYYFNIAALALVLSLFIPIGFILLALGINYFSVESAYGQESTIKPNTLGAIFSLVQEQQKGQHQHEQSNSDSIPLTDTEHLERLIPLESLFPSLKLVATPQPSLLRPEAFAPSAPEAIPPDTVLPLVTDSSTGSTIENGGVTDSSSVLSLSFEGLDETGNPVAGFQCRLDGGPSYYCTPPVNVENRQLVSVPTRDLISTHPRSNVHTFEVSAVDAAGNIDPSPASFKWNLINSIPSDTTAPDTQIVSAVASTNAAVSNRSSPSVSSTHASPVGFRVVTPGSANTITFLFAGTDNNNIVTGYECATYSSFSLPEQKAFVPCTSPAIFKMPIEPSTTPTVTGNGIDATYIFTVRAIDPAGNVDPSPAIFQWTDILATGAREEPTKTAIEQHPLSQ
jgi:hypothetical protein